MLWLFFWFNQTEPESILNAHFMWYMIEVIMYVNLQFTNDRKLMKNTGWQMSNLILTQVSERCNKIIKCSKIKRISITSKKNRPTWSPWWSDKSHFIIKLQNNVKVEINKPNKQKQQQKGKPAKKIRKRTVTTETAGRLRIERLDFGATRSSQVALFVKPKRWTHVVTFLSVSWFKDMPSQVKCIMVFFVNQKRRIVRS